MGTAGSVQVEGADRPQKKQAEPVAESGHSSSTSPSGAPLRTPPRKEPSKSSNTPMSAKDKERRKELGLDDDDEVTSPNDHQSSKQRVGAGGVAKDKQPKPKEKKMVRKVTSKSAGSGSNTRGGNSSGKATNDGEESDVIDPSKLFRGTEVKGWTKGKLIGKGATGSVYRAVEHSTGQYFCVKEIEFTEDFAENPMDRARFEQLKAEIGLLQEIDHPNVVRFIGIDKIGFCMYILMELVAGGTLSEIIKQFGALSDAKACEYTRQVAEGLAYLHDNNIVHRDIKGANILLGYDGAVKLADFGAAKRILDPQVLFKTLAGTPYWMAPEVVRQEGHGKPADVWSLGATVLQMITGLAPYQSLAPVPALFKIGHGKDVPLPDSVSASPLVIDFISSCLRRDAADRPTVRELLNHPWLQTSPRMKPQIGRLNGSTEAHQATPGAVARRELLERDEGAIEESDEIREFILHMTFARALDDDAQEEVPENGETAPQQESLPLNDQDIEDFMATLRDEDN
jgi:tRNA A-37 threonylcarbamoyl transferase component Bud32